MEPRRNLPEIPERLKARPVDERGYPVPWFVEWIDGKPDFRIMSGERFSRALRHKLCWVCGGRLTRFMAFTVGPMCAVNRISAEPPSHRDCAVFSATTCPFLTRPKAKRREAGLDQYETRESGGIMLRLNPGVTLVWVTRSYEIVRTPTGPVLSMGDPFDTLWFAEGRTATRAEIKESIRTGEPALRDMAESAAEHSDVNKRLAFVRDSLLPTAAAKETKP